MVQWLRPILQNLGFWVFNGPTPIYEYRQPSIDVIKSHHITGIVKHIYVTINYVHEKYILLNIDAVKFKNTIQPEYIGTKISTGPLLERHHY